MTSAEFKSIENHFKEHANTIAAEKMKKYVKGKFTYLGINAPLRKELLRNIFNGYKWDRIILIKFCNHAWRSTFREMQYCATDFLTKKSKLLEIQDTPFLEKLVLDKSWWDTVDSLAVHPVGSLLKRDDEQRRIWVYKWADSENMWLRRTAIIHQLKYKHDVDPDLLKHTILSANGTKEFFLNKAIGWMLREYSRTNPQFVRDFCDNTELSNLSRKEALRLM